jgi:cyclohexyl-isocyanide hydratase
MHLTIALPIYPTVDQIDVAAPWDVLSRIPQFSKKHQVELVLVAESLELVTTGQGLQLKPTQTFEKLRDADVLAVPGTQTLDAIVGNGAYTKFLRRIGKKARWVTSVCTGAVLLAEAGLLDGFRATTHWGSLDQLRSYKKVTVANGYPRWVECGNRLTTGGVSSSIDGALHLVEMLTGDAEVVRCIQLEIQYNPQPPYRGGDPAVADFETYETVTETPHPVCK